MDFVYLAASFAVILAGALVFTNAIEWAGHRLGLGEGATGSLLAAVGTAMPETLIPIVAILGGAAGSEDVAVGAIIGAPFLLATIAMAWSGSRHCLPQASPRAGNPPRRRCRARSIATSSSSASSSASGCSPAGAARRVRHIPLAIAFAVGYVVYAALTVRGGGEVQEVGPIGPLYLDRTSGDEPPPGRSCSQLLVGLARSSAAPTCSSRSCSRSRRTSGSSRWCSRSCSRHWQLSSRRRRTASSGSSDGKDSLALGNITGAMVFQSMIPVAFGLAFTDWDLDRFAVVSACPRPDRRCDRLLGAAPARALRAAPIVALGGLFVAFIVYVAMAS